MTLTSPNKFIELVDSDLYRKYCPWGTSTESEMQQPPNLYVEPHIAGQGPEIPFAKQGFDRVTEDPIKIMKSKVQNLGSFIDTDAVRLQGDLGDSKD